MTDTPVSEDDVFTMSRVFDGPPQRVWDTWTQAEHLTQWFGPAGMKLTVKTLDLTPGGIFIYGMEMAGVTLWGKWVFQDILSPSRLSYVLCFCNELGAPVRHPMAPLWPVEMLCEQSFSPQDTGKTLFQSRSWPIKATQEERAVFKAGHASMQMGFGGTFAKLDTYLANLKGA